MKYVIIGAGPAGIQMASFLDDYIVLEKGPSVCSFFRYFPRQRGFISINKARNLRFDWNSFLGDSKSFRDYSEDLYPSADDYLRYAEDFTTRKNLRIRFNYEVKSIEKLPDGTFSINGGEYTAEKVFFGIGLVPRQPMVKVHPSITVFSYANMPLDKEVYRDKTVVIIGTGNAALETADYIAPMTKFTTMFGRNMNAWNSHYPGHARSKNYTSIDSFFLKAASFTVFAGTPGDRYVDTLDYQMLKEQLETASSDILHKIDIVIFCIGFQFESKIIKDLVDLCPKSGFPLLTDNFESTKTRGLFFIGAASQARDYKKGTSAFIHGFRYNCQYIARSLKGIESMVLSRDEMIKMVFRQMNESSCLFHRFDYFCDVVEKLPDGMWKYTKEIPCCSPPVNGFTMRLGYTNKFHSESFVQSSYIYPRDAHLCVFIHPIFNTFDKQFELPEDIYNEFSDKNWHILPFMYFMDFVEGKKMVTEIRDLIRVIPDVRGGRDLFWKSESSQEHR